MHRMYMTDNVFFGKKTRFLVFTLSIKECNVQLESSLALNIFREQTSNPTDATII